MVDAGQYGNKISRQKAKQKTKIHTTKGKRAAWVGFEPITLCTLGEISTRQLSWYIGVQGSVIMGEIILYVISQNAFNLASRGSGVATNTQTESMIY